jgi:hypothetical protein
MLVTLSRKCLPDCSAAQDAILERSPDCAGCAGGMGCAWMVMVDVNAGYSNIQASLSPVVVSMRHD